MTAPDRDIFGRRPKGHGNWDHRRGEPRTFALLWTIFLMLATLVMFSSLGVAGTVTIDAYRPAVRALLLTITVGMVVLWPMTRLSQERPQRGVAAAIARDLVVVLLPTQALLWPQALPLLGAWPVLQMAALAACQAAWALVVGGMLALALTVDARPRALMRGVWMLAMVGLSIGVPMAQFMLGVIEPLRSQGPNSAMMWSPVLAAGELLRDRGLVGPATTLPADWQAIGVTAMVGVGLWVVSLGVELARGRTAA